MVRIYYVSALMMCSVYIVSIRTGVLARPLLYYNTLLTIRSLSMHSSDLSLLKQ